MAFPRGNPRRRGHIVKSDVARQARKTLRGPPPHGQRWPPSKPRLERLIEEAIVDAYGDSEQRTAFLTVLQDRLDLPFETLVLGVPVSVERVDLTSAAEIVAICCRGKTRQALPILDLPLPSPPPGGAEWIEAYRRWARGR